MKKDDKALRGYLLGLLADSEAEEHDLRIISDPEFEVEIALAEESLIEDYLDNILSDKELAAFHANFAISRERREQIRLIEGLRSFANENRSEFQPDRTIDVSVKGAFWGRFGNLTAARMPALALTAAVLVIVVGLGWFALTGRQESMSGLEIEYAALNKKDLNDESIDSGTNRVDLVSGVSRGTRGILEVVPKKGNDRYLFVLALPNSAADSQYQVVIEKNEKELFRQTDLSAYDNKVGKELRLLIPVSILLDGEHRIKLIRKGAEADPEYFYFVVD